MGLRLRTKNAQWHLMSIRHSTMRLTATRQLANAFIMTNGILVVAHLYKINYIAKLNSAIGSWRKAHMDALYQPRIGLRITDQASHLPSQWSIRIGMKFNNTFLMHLLNRPNNLYAYSSYPIRSFCVPYREQKPMKQTAVRDQCAIQTLQWIISNHIGKTAICHRRPSSSTQPWRP